MVPLRVRRVLVDTLFDRGQKLYSCDAYIHHINGLVQESVLAMELCLSCTNPLILANIQCHCMFAFVMYTVYPKKYAHGFCFAVLCCGYTLTDFPISIRLTSLALWQSNDCPSASKATLMNMDKYFMWIHYERLHNHNKAKHNKTVCIFLGIYCTCMWSIFFQILTIDTP